MTTVIVIVASVVASVAASVVVSAITSGRGWSVSNEVGFGVDGVWPYIAPSGQLSKIRCLSVRAHAAYVSRPVSPRGEGGHMIWHGGLNGMV